MFKKEYSYTVSNCPSGFAPSSGESDLDCSLDTDDNTPGCQALRSSQSAAKATIAFAVIKFVSVLFPLYLVWNGDSGISLSQLKMAGILQFLISFMFMISCFVTTGHYRDFLFDETTIVINGILYSVNWTVGSSWYLMLFAGLMNISMMIYSGVLLYNTHRAATMERPQVFSTVVVVAEPPLTTTTNPVGVGAYNPPQTVSGGNNVVKGRVLKEDGANNTNEV